MIKDMSCPEISVIVPVYNVERYLRQCMDSLVNQTYTDFEIILVNDGSTDSSGVLCEEWAKKDGRIHVVHKKNEGLGFARNTGIEHAKGKYITFVDSDDYVSLDMLQTLHMLFKNMMSKLYIVRDTIVHLVMGK